jgi:Fic family protein
VLAAEASSFGSSGRRRNVNAVLYYVGALDYGLTRLAELPVSVRLIREIHQGMLEGVRGGRPAPAELRRSHHWTVPSGGKVHEATFVPPSPQLVPGALSEPERFLHQVGDLPELIEIGLADAQFGTIPRSSTIMAGSGVS